jgi:hypothetical protein
MHYIKEIVFVPFSNRELRLFAKHPEFQAAEFSNSAKLFPPIWEKKF